MKSQLGTTEYFKISVFPSSLCLRHTASRQGLARNTESEDIGGHVENGPI